MSNEPDQTEANAVLIEQTFERVAERAGDITGRVFDRYFERSAASRALMDHMDEHMLGRMMEQVLLLLMERGDSELDGYLAFETQAHTSYGVDQTMYAELMGAVTDVIASALGDDFQAEERAAFDARTRYLLDAIAAATAQAAS